MGVGVKVFVLSVLVFFTGVTFAKSGVSPCAGDDYMSTKIKEDYTDSELNLAIFNKEQAVTGVVMLDEGTKEANSLYLCGDNSGYYYVKNTSLNDIRQGRIWFFNDEYDSEVNFEETLKSDKVHLRVKVYSESSNPDHEPFEADLFVNLNPTKKLPF